MKRLLIVLSITIASCSSNTEETQHADYGPDPTRKAINYDWTHGRYIYEDDTHLVKGNRAGMMGFYHIDSLPSNKESKPSNYKPDPVEEFLEKNPDYVDDYIEMNKN